MNTKTELSSTQDASHSAGSVLASYRRSSETVNNPRGNTGVNPGGLEFGIGWFTVSYRVPSDREQKAYANYVARIYENISLDYFVRNGGGLSHYEFHKKFNSGAMLFWSPGVEHQCLNMNQKALDRLSPKRLAKTMYALLALPGARLTRLDLYWDDYGGRITTDRVEDALRGGHFPSKSVQYSVNRSFCNEEVEGDTVYIGSRQSDFFVRVYNKDLESQGKQKCIRLEVQMRKETAAAFLSGFVWSDYTQWPDRALQLLLSRFDFTLRRGPRREKTSRRFYWWAELIRQANAVPFRVPQVAAKLLSTIAWCDSVLPTTLAMLYEVAGATRLIDWVDKLVSTGRARFKRKHLGMMSDFVESFCLAGNPNSAVPNC